jgi:hypothetical protein
VRDPERAGAILFVNFDESSDWIAMLADDDPKVKQNLAPLDGLGVSVWQDGDVGHGLVRLTTD